MMNKSKNTLLATTLGAVVIGSLSAGAAVAQTNPFGMELVLRTYIK